ncbi:N-acetylmuramoyl-L-alanine amidase [Virgibacillus halodenitrificans]|uniref:N-acetylmuramoyl-L-alanine amidase n=1 Tax=Virgibacillus halodenitrificans TaxID=1482 RepID=UPI000EF559BF|nr:N-acetylmuramoyl-L-alanine amidase [Virgibacillus halodenitrificans]
MVKVAIGAGHGYNTSGKRSPAGEREWSFNNKVVTAAIKYLYEYQNVSVIRMDDPTGNTDVPLRTRTNNANNANADILVSYHHNANTGTWGSWTGTETYHYPGSSSGNALARAIHPSIVGAMGIRDRGVKSANFHMVRESRMPAILIEGGFMDSTIDIKKMRDNTVMDRTGKALADAIASYFGLNKKPSGNAYVEIVTDALWTYNTANWDDKAVIVNKGEVFTVVKDKFKVGNGYMYQIKSGLYITANPTYVRYYTK